MSNEDNKKNANTEEVNPLKVDVIDTNEFEEDGTCDIIENLIDTDMNEIEEEFEDEEHENISSEDEDYEDDSFLKIKQHQGSIFCIDSYNFLFATGGEDDKMFLSKYSEKIQDLTLEDVSKRDKENEFKNIDILIESEKFKDSVTIVKFSCDGKYIAAADMSGNIRVYLIELKDLHWSFDTENEIECMNWHPNCNVLFCGSSDGNFYMFKLSTNEVKVMYSGDGAGLSCFRILTDGKRAACCYKNGNVKIWDLKASQIIFNYPNAHENEVLCVDVNPDGNLLATAGLDLKVHLINTTNGKFITYLNCQPDFNIKAENKEIENEYDDSIETLGFSKASSLLACATLNGKIFIWDLNSHTIRNKLENNFGYSKLVWNTNGLIYLSCLDGSLQIYDYRNLGLVKKYKCHTSEILDFCINYKLKIVITVSNSGFVKIFKLV